ncbi:palmitoyl-protein thioesterase family protein [Aspergillus ibericus CBS 121593]|uniref:Palmitoyl-protein thioesterase 1 n=1 Tax=Aspergillus ibericus CBS 121593 TaxID=1448316 RepID=A0A395H1T6_9EURO|nr:alpha/beta-hydrolase [Aspergillus ibericus CBS 121593]RAL01852.1 alpha/beta-hydrolase [Aspergillus ibericus CBS 121593]
MRPLTPLLTLLTLPLTATTHPTTQTPQTTPINTTINTTTELRPLPLVIWHGLGDNYLNPSLQSLITLAEKINPGTYTHLIHLSPSSTADRQATFLGNLTTQINQICAQLAADPILSTAPAINALGFSQGGQFLRGYIERCNSPPVHNLVTLGSQHNGISQFQACEWTDLICRGSEALLRSGRWSPFVQGRLIPAQYFRDASSEEEMEAYLENSNFLADINNERLVKNYAYKENLGRLNKFVMYMFEKDRMVHPKESSWFGDVDGSGEVVELRDREVYKEDWLGLKGLDEKGGLVFRTLEGGHMDVDEEALEGIFEEWFGDVEVEFDQWGVGTRILVNQEGNY